MRLKGHNSCIVGSFLTIVLGGLCYNMGEGSFKDVKVYQGLVKDILKLYYGKGRTQSFLELKLY